METMHKVKAGIMQVLGICNHRSVRLYDPDRNVSDRNPLFL